jgi:hypothetical protein
MPATTALSPVPAPRPGAELSIAAVPGYYLSESVRETPKGTPLNQASVMAEPGELIGVPGLSVGGRYVGKSDDGGYPEPLVRYRLHLDPAKRSSAALVGYGTHATGDSRGASYTATRGGAELMFDFRATPESKWIELHLFGGGSLTGLSARGDYCIDQDGRFGQDCPDPPDTGNKVHASVGGFYPSASGGVAFDLARHLSGVLHGGRIAAHGAFGTMPRVEGAEQQSAASYGALGLSVTLGLGAAQ